jgi:hypothetical protein
VQVPQATVATFALKDGTVQYDKAHRKVAIV